ncbi:quinone-dependent dihydroorotate dehydrogenase [Zeaxanthinibacter enoshimensis]|uniref:Dihydroorotate dehydrogenase (quinone) n=1 Tax=Zeaxanthinibacter enoshimensis TaxID=392009 RepID=A0A4R6TFU7_9FLAO|nr:quinone-dependent dihydroorotate dehydrogenase [Zeaxanthinibacter enoshimensis]TDQ29215.1 dihydroorotate dehydrogenase [Zeaxanthinibacter enoshimensis]
MYKTIIRPIFFLFDPESIHHFTFRLIKLLSSLGFGSLFRAMYEVKDPLLHREVFGLQFKNPVGLAAGFDKDALLYKELGDFGFGFVEIGTLTPKPQQGNPKKRLFRLKADHALINRMGFNNGGVKAAAERLSPDPRILVGGNIGKNKVTPNERAMEDYLICFRELFTKVDYFAVNVSSPNTPGLRELQDKAPLTALLKGLREENTKLSVAVQSKEKPILLKIAPDLTDSQLLDIIAIVEETGIQGVIATNTTLDRSKLRSAEELRSEKGGLSGEPLGDRSAEVIRFLHTRSNGAFPIIGVGGIHSEQDALEKLEAGASLVQLWTGFVYEGPALVKRINKAILQKERAKA